MKYLAKCFACLFVLLLTNRQAQAAHVTGGEISYTYAGNDSFDITMKLYRDCNGMSGMANSLSIASACKTWTVLLDPVSVRDITGVPQQCGQQSRCSGTFQYGVEEHIFKKRIYIGGDTCCAYTLYRQECCRNTGINGPAADFYVETKLNKCLWTNNSSPFFSTTARILLPVSSIHFLSFKAIDPDGDILTYELTPPLKDSASSVQYSGNFSYKRPLSFQGFPNENTPFPGGFRLDSLTGNLAFKPTKQNEVFYLAVKVNEWRKINGTYTKIGEVTRDLTMVVLPAGNNIPYFLKETSEVPFCNGGTSYCINIPVRDNDSTDTLSFTYNHQLSNITFNNVGTVQEPIIRACYTPTTAELASGIPLTFTITATDNKCTLAGVTEKTFLITPKPMMPDSFSISKTVVCSNVQLEFINTTTSLPAAKAHWEIAAAQKIYKSDSALFVTHLGDTGWHTIKMSVAHAGFCEEREYWDSVYISPSNSLSVSLGNDTAVCFDSSFTIFPNINNGTLPLQYVWSGGDSTAIVTKILQKGKYLHSLTVTDANMCTATDSIWVDYRNPTVTIIGDTAVCRNDTAQLAAHMTDTVNAVFGWTAGHISTQATIKVPLAANTQFSFTLTDGAGCTVTKNHTVTVSNPQPSVHTKSSFCQNSSLTLRASATGGIKPYGYLWAPYSLTGDSITITPQNPGYEKFSVNVTDAAGCTNTLTDSVFIHPLPLISITPPSALCVNAPAIVLTTFATPTGGTWAGTGVSGNTFSPAISGPGSFSLLYNYTDTSTGCSTSDSTVLQVQAQPVAGFTVDSTIAHLGHTFQFTDTTKNPTGLRQWDFDDPASGSSNTSALATPVHNFTDTGVYKVSLRAAGGVCNADTATLAIKVYKGGAKSVAPVSGQKFNIYPNPVSESGVLVIETDRPVAAQVIDILGRKIDATVEKISPNTLYITGLKAGVYGLQLYDAGGIIYHGNFIVRP